MMFRAYDIPVSRLNPEFTRYLKLTFHERKMVRRGGNKPERYLTARYDNTLPKQQKEPKPW